ncbi:hypothetical protein CYLTODRAFT_408780 [Cylindrobasidium torrendii FP15055 ss-10]|uniref:Uncharacterized protein n=1 Tax=Cylindrobasidium torrendii FP15055 ss-10 TaxID=1314674 RepID=A0A0D7BJ10_9AGAR|nr:hypothetical protein CYLTODRAFT_408780 [Cylindrobasidium torrendii FP15055 ss-10]
MFPTPSHDKQRGKCKEYSPQRSSVFWTVDFPHPRFQDNITAYLKMECGNDDRNGHDSAHQLEHIAKACEGIDYAVLQRKQLANLAGASCGNRSGSIRVGTRSHTGEEVEGNHAKCGTGPHRSMSLLVHGVTGQRVLDEHWGSPTKIETETRWNNQSGSCQRLETVTRAVWVQSRVFSRRTAAPRATIPSHPDRMV